MNRPVLTQYDPDEEDYEEVLPKDEPKAMQIVLDRRIPTPSKRDKKQETSSLRLRVDNPGGKWLQEKLKDPSVTKYNSKGSPMSFGSVTAYYDKDVLIPVRVLAKLKGVSGEHTFVRQESFSSLKKFMSENNKLPPLPHDLNTQYTPFIQVNYAGDAWINEGNHRVKVAADLGWEYLPVAIRYFLGGEDEDEGPLSPRKVNYYNEKALAQGYSVEDFRGTLSK